MSSTESSDGNAWLHSCFTHTVLCLAVKQVSSGPSKRGERSEDSSNWLQLPLLGFGPFLALASNASQGCHPADSNKWPFGTCTLLASGKQAKAASAAEGKLLLVHWTSTGCNCVAYCSSHIGVLSMVCVNAEQLLPGAICV
jgi:hypothetical protein